MGRLAHLRKGVGRLSVYESQMIALTFGLLIIALLAYIDERK
ncbi:MAG: putative holin-like toxin [Oscillospiraceae bacterium]|nr:putative holin-like toxin [Oscillospiraceae bacterium]